MSLPKTIALLALNGDFGNQVVKNTLEFYWKNYPQEYKSFPILNTEGNIETTIKLLENSYKLGYRYFVGFTSSTTVAGILDWFNLHPDAIGISPSSTALSLSIPKKIFRMSPTDNYILDSVTPQLENATKIYYIYTLGELAPLNILELLENNPSLEPKLVPYGAKPDNSNLTVQDMQTLFQNATSTDCVLLYLFNRRFYINLYSQGLTFPGSQYDIIGGTPPPITGEASNQLNGKYNVSTFKGTNTSIIWRDGYNTLGQTNYNTKVLNILNLLNSLVSNQSVENINSHFGILEFDPVTSDLIYPSFLIETFTNGNYISSFLFVDSPLLGKYQANFIE